MADSKISALTLAAAALDTHEFAINESGASKKLTAALLKALIAPLTVEAFYRLTADGSAIGSSIADVFPATSSFPTVTNGIYLIEFHIFFLKTTTGTVTWTVTNTQAYTNVVGYATVSPSAGMATITTAGGGGLVAGTTAALAFPASPSLTTATNHYHRIFMLAECGTAGNIRLRVSCSASGTITPLRGSHYIVRHAPAGNIGSFVA